MLIVSLASMTQLFGFHGGIIGAFIKQIFASFLGLIGAGVILNRDFPYLVALITNFSIFSVFSDFELAWQNFQIRFGDYFVGYRNWREARNLAAIERLEKRNKLREEVAETSPTISPIDGVPTDVEKQTGRRRSKRLPECFRSKLFRMELRKKISRMLSPMEILNFQSQRFLLRKSNPFRSLY